MLARYLTLNKYVDSLCCMLKDGDEIDWFQFDLKCIRIYFVILGGFSLFLVF